MTYEQVGQLTFTQIRNAQHAGKKPVKKLGKKDAHRILKEFKQGVWTA